MRQIVAIFLLSFLGLQAAAQFNTTQTTGTSTTLVKSRGGQGADSGFIVPNFPDTSSFIRISKYAGGLIKVGNTLYLRDSVAQKWIPIGNGFIGGDTADFAPVIDSTGNFSFRVLYAVNNKIVGSAQMTYDTAFKQLNLRRLYSQDAFFETISLTTTPDIVPNYDPVTDGDNFVLLFDAASGLFKIAQWAASGGTTYTAGNGINIDGNTIRWADTLSNSSTSLHVNQGLTLQSDNLTGNGDVSFIAVSPVDVTTFSVLGSNYGLVSVNPNGIAFDVSDSIRVLTNGGGYAPSTTSTDKYKVVLMDSATGSFVTISPDSLGGGGDLSGYVPYIGATQKVILGSNGLQADHLDFKTTPTAADSVQRLSWDSAFGTLEVGLRGGNVKLQVGQEEVILIRNNTGSPLNDGQIVYITGSTGEVPTVALANNKNFLTSSRTLGMVTEPIAHGAEGFVTITGIINGLNTNALTEGAPIWLDSIAGAYTQTMPQAPYNEVLLGYVVKKSGGNGSIFIRAQNSFDTSYIRNQFNARENKTAWLQKLMADSLIGGRFSLIKDSIPITTTNVWVLTNDTVTNLVQRRLFPLNSNYILFDNTTRNIRSENAGNGDSANLFNTFIGDSAGWFNTRGARNFALGNNALENNRAGRFNIAIGDEALNSLRLGAGSVDVFSNRNSYNTAIGYRALLNANNTPSDGSPRVSNTAIGAFAGQDVTTGRGNVFIGTQAGLGTTTGISNVIIGAGNVGNGSERVVIGAASSTVNSGGISIGYPSTSQGIEAIILGRGDMATGSNVIAMGAEAGRNMSGSNNFLFGLRSGRTFSAINTGGSNIFLGVNILAGTDSARNTNRNIIIGHNSADSLRGTANDNIIVGNSISPLTNISGSNQLVLGSNGVPYILKATTQNYLINAAGTDRNSLSINQSASFEINGTAGGVLFPRLNTTQQNAISSPATGLLLYNTSSNTLNVHTSAWRNIPNGLKGEAVLDFPSTGAHSSSDLTLTVTGAEVGDIVMIGAPVPAANSFFNAFVSATDTVTVRYNYYGTSSADPASATFKVYVIKD